MKVAHAVVIADIRMQIGAGGVQGEAHVFEIATGGSQLVIVGNDHAAFARSDVLVGKEAECRDTR